MNHNMFPSSSSESSMSGATTSAGGGGLMRYASAPSSMISTAVESVIGGNRHHHQFLFPSSEPSVASDSSASAKPNLNDRPFFIVNDVENHNKPATNNKTTTTSTTNYGFPHQHDGGQSSSSYPQLVRHSSSPAQFFNHLAVSARGGDSSGFSITSGGGNYNSTDNGRGGGGILRLNSQLSYTSPKEVLSRISEETEGLIADNSNTQRKATNSNSYGNNHNNGITSFGSILSTTSWDENNQISFSAPSNKRSKGGIINDIDGMEHHQFQFSMSHVPIDMYSKMDKLVHIPHDSVPCKVRAKRGCATHPRSIAERERRTRISGKLKKLQDLVPNMDKQTSYADMLDLAVQHIKSLQNHVEKLNKELESCTCGCKTIKDS